MSKTTTNFGFIKPELTDAADITATNKNWDTLDEKLKNTAPAYTYGTSDLTPGTSALETGKLYFVYE